MSVQRSSSNLLFLGVLGAIGGVYLLGLLILRRPDSRRIAPEQVAEILEAEGRSKVTPTERGAPTPDTFSPLPPVDTASQPTSEGKLDAAEEPASAPDGLEEPVATQGWEVAGRIDLPPSSPDDPTLRLVALPAPPKALYEPWNPPDWNDHAEGDRVEVRIENDGSFALQLPLHWEHAFLDLSGRFLFFDEPLEIVQDPEREPAALVLRPRLGAWVRGQVLDAAGQALAENFVRRTRVSAVPDLDAMRDALAQGGLHALVNERLSARPDDAGAFELRGVPPRITFLLAPVAEGLLPGEARSLNAQPGAEQTLDFRMAPGQSVTGKVTDADGLPLSGVRVSYRGDLELDGFAPLFGSWSVLDATDESGNFELRGLPEGSELSLACELEGWVLPEPLRVDTTRSDEILAVLKRGHVVEGRVQWQDGSPAPGFEVRLERRSRALASLTTDEEGHFRAIGLSDEPFSLAVSGVEPLASGRSRVGWQRVSAIDPTTRAVLVTLGQGTLLSGQVTAVDGRPITEFEVECMPLDVEGSPEGIRTRFSSLSHAAQADTAMAPKEPARPNGAGSEEGGPNAGRFQLEGLQQGSWSVLVRAPGFVDSEPHNVRLPWPAGSERRPFELIPTGSAMGTVLGPDGRPVAGARLRNLVSWQDDRGNPRSASASSPESWRSDAFGCFRVLDLAPGTYHWLASAPGYAASRTVEVIVSAGREIEGIQISLREGGVLTGRLLDERNLPVAGRFISIARADFLDARTGRTDASGTFSFRELEPGKWRVYALPEGEGGGQHAPLERLALSSEVVIHDGDESHVVLGGRPEPEILVSHLQGIVVDPRGRAREGVLISLSEDGPLSTRSPYGTRRIQTQTDLEGRFHFESLPLGTYNLCALPTEESRLAPRIVRKLVLDEDSNDVEELDIQLEEGGSLAGRVLDPEGLPMPGASIFVRDQDGLVLAHISELASDAEGFFRYPALLPGRYTVLARTHDGSTEESEALLVVPGEETTTEIVLGPGTLLSILLRTKTGQPLQARVLVLDQKGRRVNGLVGMETLLREIESGFSDTEQMVGPLAPGTYRVRATFEDGREVGEDIELTGEPAERLVLLVE